MADRDYDEIADPLLIARLASWFGEGPLPPPRASEVPADPERDERQARIEAGLDRALVARLEAARSDGDALLWRAADPLPSPFEDGPMTARWTPPRDEFEDETLWELPQPEDIHDALKEDNAPQAVLRDLFRPVRFFGDVALRRVSPGEQPDLLEGRQLTREAMATSWTLNLEPLPPALIASDIGDLRAALARPWAQSEVRGQAQAVQDDDDESESSSHYRWFGIEGGYDPDQ